MATEHMLHSLSSWRCLGLRAYPVSIVARACVCDPCVTVPRRATEAWRRSSSCRQARWRGLETVLRALTHRPTGIWEGEPEQERDALIKHGEKYMRPLAASPHGRKLTATLGRWCHGWAFWALKSKDGWVLIDHTGLRPRL